MKNKILKQTLTPIQVWKNNKSNIDLRIYTLNFKKLFEKKNKLTICPGNVYAATYASDYRVLTDKHHVMPLFLSFGCFRDDVGRSFIRGLNLFFLSKDQRLQILEEIYKFHDKKPSLKVVPTIAIHEKWIRIVPWAFKNFEETRILKISEINHSEWGMIPLIHDKVFGTFNARALNEDFGLENSVVIKQVKRKKNKKIEDVLEDNINDVMEINSIESFDIDDEDI